MDAKRTLGQTPGSAPVPSNYVQLALRALSEMSRQDPAGFDRSQLLSAFCHAFTLEDSEHRTQVLSYLRRAGLTDEDIIDRIIPTAARRIGEQWVSDELTFAEVTIGAARMQELARMLGGRGSAVPTTIPLGFNALLIIPKEEQHTMGAFVAADQLRRRGMWVHMAIGQDASELHRTVSNDHFSMVGISAASRGSLKSVKSIVQILRDCDDSIPIVLGGNILNIVKDVKPESGVDHVTSDPTEAIEVCGLPISRHAVSDTGEFVR